MPVTININNLSLCHKGSNGISIATVPDVCKTPSPGGPVPVPYSNVAFSHDLIKGTTTIEADGGNMCANYGSEFSKSTGDEPGTVGGVKSNTFIKEATWLTFSFDVKLEGKGACRLTDKMFHNHQNTVDCAGLFQDYLDFYGDEDEACEKLREQIENLMDTPNGKVPTLDPKEIAAAARKGKPTPLIGGLKGRIQAQLYGSSSERLGTAESPLPTREGHPDSTILNPNNQKNKWDNHQTVIEAAQSDLQESIDEYKKHCGDPPDGAEQMAKAPLPTKEDARKIQGPLPPESPTQTPSQFAMPLVRPVNPVPWYLAAGALIARYWWLIFAAE